MLRTLALMMALLAPTPMVFAAAPAPTPVTAPAPEKTPAVAPEKKPDEPTAPVAPYEPGPPLKQVQVPPTKGDDPFSILLQLMSGGAKPEAKCPEKGNCVPSYRFDKEVDDESVGETVDWLDAWETAGAKAVVIEFNTPGGSVDAGFTLAHRIEDAKVPVHCVVDGDAASMGFYLLQSCTTREMTKRSTLMAHTPSLSGGISDARQLQFNNYAERMRVMADAMSEHCQHRLKVSIADYKFRTRDGAQWWMNWQEGLNYGAVDQIAVSAKAVKQALEKNLKLPDPVR